MSIILERGQRGILVGQTGSGKTWGAIYQLQHSDSPLVIVLDTKGESAFNRLPCDEHETHAFYDSGESAAAALKSRDLPNYMIVRPDPDEIADPLQMDDILRVIYSRGRECLTYIDEAYQWHVNGRAGAGLTGLLTRGRSKGISTLIATQRPAWISRFCFSEAQKFYIYRLLDQRDKKTLAEQIPNFDVKASLARYHFMYYDNASDMMAAKLYRPVPAPLKRPDITPQGTRWI